MSSFRTLSEVQKTTQPIFLRADLNIPLKKNEVVDSTRIERIIPTIKKLFQKTDKIVLTTHIGRPQMTNEINQEDPFSTFILVPLLQKHLNIDVYFLNQCIDYEDSLKKPGLYILQNVRFYEGEEKNDHTFAQKLLGPCRIYVNDAFSCSHRAHASVCAITKYAKSFAGLLMENELNNLLPLIQNSKHPFMAIVGGSKVSTKIKLIQNLLKKVDSLVIGGAMANTFLKAKGIDIGKSLHEESYLPYCKDLLASREKDKIFLPIDFNVGQGLEDHNPTLSDAGEDIDGMILDFGPKSVDSIKKMLSTSALVMWNGPVGAYEYPPYEKSSLELADAIAHLTKKNVITSIAGGGDTLALLQRKKMVNEFTYTSTAGGAFLELLEGRTLPGVEALYVS
jgi:phosphoglycerate kinase